MSTTTSENESKYCSFELEMLAVVKAVEKFRVYLLGIHFKLVTDCNSLKLAISKKDINLRIARWILTLFEFHYTIEHRSGTRMSHVDALSRYMLIDAEDPILNSLRILQNKDQEIKNIKESIINGTNSDNNFELYADIVYRKVKDKILFFIPRAMRRSIVEISHDTNNHFGLGKTIEFLKNSY